MQDTSQLEGISIATSLGLLAEEMVLAVGRLLRGDPPEAADEQSLDRGQEVLRDLGAGRSRTQDENGPRRLAAEQSALAALQAAQLQAPEEDAQLYAPRLVDALQRSRAGEQSENLNDDLQEIRKLFVAISQLTLESANDMARGTPEFEAWLNAPMTLRS